MHFLQFLAMFMLMASMVIAASVESMPESQPANTCPMIACCGSNGLPGRDGQDGKEGPRGDKGERGVQGPQGPPGKAGPQGAVGPSGVGGEQGTAGEKGQKGENGGSELDLLKQRVSALDLQMKNLQEAVASLKAGAILKNSRSVGEKLFVNTRRELFFEEAEETCVKLGAFLASPINSAENTAVHEVVSEAGKIAYLGVNDIQTEGSFVYPSGEEITYSNWSPNEPNGGRLENCVEMYTNSKWNDKSCQTKRLVICEFLIR